MANIQTDNPFRIPLEQRREITDLYEQLGEHVANIDRYVSSFNSIVEDLQWLLEVVQLEMDAYIDRQPAKWLDTPEGTRFDEWMSQWPGHGDPQFLDNFTWRQLRSIDAPALSPDIE